MSVGNAAILTSVSTATIPRPTREVILEVAFRRFADQGYERTSLDAIAEEVGIRRPSLLHHFPSKETLYRAIVLRPFEQWVRMIQTEGGGELQGWARIEEVLDASFRFFAAHPDFVRLARREAAAGGPVFWDELAGPLRPLFDGAVRYLEGEMEAGRIRRHDARQLIFTAYGAIVSYFSDGPLVRALVGQGHLGHGVLEERRRHLLDFFRVAFAPDPSRLEAVVCDRTHAD